MKMLPVLPRCIVPGCQNPARVVPFGHGGWGRICEPCRQRGIRQGDPRQQRLLKSDVTPYVHRVEKLIQLTGNGERVEVALKDISRILAEVARDPAARAVVRRLRHLEGSKPWVVRWKVQATNEILRVVQDTDAVQSGILVAAVFLLQSKQPHRFISPLAFQYQLTRVWRARTFLSVGSYWDNQRGKVTRIYRELPRRSTEIIAEYLTVSYAKFVAFILKADREQAGGLVPLLYPLTS